MRNFRVILHMREKHTFLNHQLFLHMQSISFSLLLRQTEFQRIRQGKMQSASKITLAQHGETHPIKTLNTVLIIMFPIEPFYQGLQSQIYSFSVLLWTSLILASLPPFPLLNLCSKFCLNWMDNHFATKSVPWYLLHLLPFCSAS